MSVCCECCVLSGRGLCDGLITCPEESYGCLSVVSVVCCQVEVCATDCITRPEESYGCLSVVNVVCCQVEVSAMGRSLVQSSPTECDVSNLGPLRVYSRRKKSQT